METVDREKDKEIHEEAQATHVPKKKKRWLFVVGAIIAIMLMLFASKAMIPALLSAVAAAFTANIGATALETTRRWWQRF